MSGLLAASIVVPACAGWVEDEVSLEWTADGRPAWRFCHDPALGKPHFHPLAAGGVELTSFRPADHPWHYGLWFSWKFINGVNYWEEDRESARAEGRTRWTRPETRRAPDGQATITLALEYVHPSGRVDLRERRQLVISAPDESAAFHIDWLSEFIAGPEGAVLDRTPMPGEPDGRVNGGYAGLSIRLAPAPNEMTVTTDEGAVTEFRDGRARPAGAAAAANFRGPDGRIGGVAVLAGFSDVQTPAPWYIIGTPEVRFLCAAVLAPSVRRLAPGEAWTLRYRISLRPGGWTRESLRAEIGRWRGAGLPDGGDI